LIELTNRATAVSPAGVSREVVEPLLLMTAPFAPHLAPKRDHQPIRRRHDDQEYPAMNAAADELADSKAPHHALTPTLPQAPPPRHGRRTRKSPPPPGIPPAIVDAPPAHRSPKLRRPSLSALPSTYTAGAAADRAS